MFKQNINLKKGKQNRIVDKQKPKTYFLYIKIKIEKEKNMALAHLYQEWGVLFFFLNQGNNT